jgi:penicillin-binding protein 2
MKRGEKGKLNTRIWMLIVVFVAMLGVLLVFLDKLAIRETEAYSAAVQQTTEVTTYQSGRRGTITDRNGVVLAYDETTYNVLFYRDPNNRTPVDSARYTQSLIEAIRIIEEGGGKTIDTFYINMLSDGTFVYDFRTSNESVAASRKRNFIDACNFSNKDLSAEEAYRILRASWCIPDEMPFDEAKKIMSIRQEAVMNSYRAFEGVRIATDVSLAVVTELDMQSDRLTGILTEKSSYRVYPYGHTASHIVGYLSKQVTRDMTGIGYSYDAYAPFDPKHTETNSMLALGYSYNDLIGVAGVEKTMEAYLTPHLYGRLGTTRILKNKRGAIVEVLDSMQPTDGMNVQLTIDIELQKVVEQALRDNIEATRKKQEDKIRNNRAKYEKLTNGNTDSIKRAETGSIIVMNVKTGEILAMASYPDYDPNMFTDGIDELEYEELFGKGKNQPTLNRAIGIRTASGSVFKMATGFAGLMEGKLTTEERISDHSPYYYFVDDPKTKVEQNAPSCWTSNPSRHANLNLARALTVSCNYFFYTVADRVGIERLNHWAGRLGIQGTTGVELPGELNVQVGGQKARYDCEKPLSEQMSSMPRLIYNRIYSLLRSINEQRELGFSDVQLSRCADRLLRLMDGEQRERGAEIREILKEELNIPIGVSYAHTSWIVSISTWLEELRWKPTYTIQTGIGQGVMLVTPISIARYVSTIANRGSVYQATLLKEIDNSDGTVYLKNEPNKVDSIEAPDAYWDAILEGMKGVVSPEDGGTASSVFSMRFGKDGYLEKISGKTGTAQTAASNNIDIENTCWFVAITSREDPEIAIVVFIPNGLSGSSGAVAVEEIVTYWYERDSQTE